MHSFLRNARQFIDGNDAMTSEIRAYLNWLIRFICNQSVLLNSGLYQPEESDENEDDDQLTGLVLFLIEFGRRWRTGTNRLLIELLMDRFVSWPEHLMLHRYFPIITHLAIYGPGAISIDVQFEHTMVHMFNPAADAAATPMDSNINSFSVHESLPRIYLCAQLTRLDPHNELHCKFARQLCRYLMDLYRSILDKGIHEYVNSTQSLLKLRCWQAVLCMLDLVIGDCASTAMSLGREVIAFIQTDKSLPIRHFMEQVMVRLIMKWPAIGDQLIWQRLAVDVNLKPGFVCSLLLIIKLAGPHLATIEDQTHWFRTLFDQCQAWTIHNHNMVRLYTLWTLWTAYHYCTAPDTE
jgi:hypothetical protein